MDFGKARGSQLLKDVALKNQAMSNALVVRDLDIDQIADNPDNAFLFGMEQSDIEHTAEGIRLNGFHGAVEVFEDGKGGYEMFSGHIRKYGAKQAGLKKIPAIINPMPEETHKRRLLVGANLYGRNKVKSGNPIYTGRQLAYHKETLKMENFHGDIREQLAKEFGISGAQCHRYMALLELIDPLQDIAAQGIAPFSLLSGVKGFDKGKQEKLAEYIMEKYTENGEPLTSKELRACMDKMAGESPVPGQMKMNDYNISSETVSIALDDIPVQAEDDSEECNDCMLNNNPDFGDMECHPEDGEHKCYSGPDEEEAEEEVVHDEQKIPPVYLIVEAYEEMGRDVKEIKDYYKLKNHLIDNYGKTHHYRGGCKINFKCSLRGIKINSYEEITWTMFLDILSEYVLELDKTKESEPFVSVKVNNGISDIERLIYKVESQVSCGALNNIKWSKPQEAYNIIKSLVAMLTDEINFMDEV